VLRDFASRHAAGTLLYQQPKDAEAGVLRQRS